jgi:hypothetical protein
MDLPLEVRMIIYRMSLVNNEENFVPREGMPPLPGFRYRHQFRQKRQGLRQLHSLRPILWKANLRSSCCWFNVLGDYALAKPINHSAFAFGLLFTSRSIYNEATPMFFQANHFIFEDLFSLHMFIKTVSKENIGHVRSVSLSWLSNQDHQRQAYLRECKKRMRDPRMKNGRGLAMSVIELHNACPVLEYLEMLPKETTLSQLFGVSTLDPKFNNPGEMTRALCDLTVKKFSFVLPRLKRIERLGREGRYSLQDLHALSVTIGYYHSLEAYVNKEIRAKVTLRKLEGELENEGCREMVTRPVADIATRDSIDTQ